MDRILSGLRSAVIVRDFEFQERIRLGSIKRRDIHLMITEDNNISKSYMKLT